MVKIADKVNEKIGKLTDKTIREIYTLFTYLAFYILFFGSMYYTAIQMVKTTGKVNILLLPAETIIHMPPYVLLAMIILLIALFIDDWNDTVKRAKTNKNNG